MSEWTEAPSRSVKSRLRRPLTAAAAAVVAGVVLSPTAAHASATLSASAQSVWGATSGVAQSNAEAQAKADLLSLASSRGFSTCVDVTYSDTLVYIVPGGGGYVYNSTATGLCGNQTLQ